MAVYLASGLVIPNHDPDDPRLVPYFWKGKSMDPISIGATMGAQAVGSYFNYKGQKETNEQNQAMAREQMAFQERMSNSAHQREVKDLYAAGLNPILSATGGSGASAPSGASSTSQNPMMGNLLTDSINTGMTAAQTQADLRIKDAAVAKTLADTANSLEQAKVIGEDIRGRRASNARNEGTVDYDINRSRFEAQAASYTSRKGRAEAQRSETALAAERADLGRAMKQSKFDESAIKYDNTIKRVQSGLNVVTSALGAATPVGRAATAIRGASNSAKTNYDKGYNQSRVDERAYQKGKSK